MKILPSHKTFIILLLLAVTTSCSVEKNTNLSRFYHNLTSHYNIYFNGKQSYMKGLEKIKSSNKDDYTTIMPLFEFSNPDAVKSAASDMERAMQKASKVISMHSMTAKPERKGNKPITPKEKKLYEKKDYNNWVDDSYLLLGQAQFMKHDFINARVTLLHNIRETDDANMRAETQTWLVRCYAEMLNYQEALRLLAEIKTGSLSDQQLADIHLSKADIYIKQELYAEAIDPLTLSLELLKGNKPKNRYTYILARLHEEEGNTLEAEKAYKEVLQLSPPYELEFNARINQAGVFDIESGDINSIKKELNKLLKDIKNLEYQDQIYYALGMLSMREGKIDKAIEYILKSAAVSTVNSNQKGRSYLVLAEHYFNENDYSKAQIYYDSTVTFLDKDYPGYKDLNSQSLNLNELAGHISTIELEDSLQYVASLNEAQQQALINGIIRDIEEKERLGKVQTEDRYNMGQFYENQRRFKDNIDAGGKWYFYNQAALTFGRTEFRSRWGQRKLEDNWRRKNKAQVNSMSSIEENGIEASADTVAAIRDIKSPEYYLKNLPLNDSLLAISNNKIAASLFNSARVFNDKFKDNEKANLYYSKLLSRYPEHNLIPQALYNVYNLNKDIDRVISDSHKALLIQKYPDTEYAKIVSNPNYYNTLRQIMQREEKLYNSAYEAWKSDSYDMAIMLCEEGLDIYPDGELKAKFMLLKAFSMAPSVDERTLKKELQLIGTEFPGSDEAARASELIAHINRETPELKLEDEIKIARDIYSTEITGEHHFVVIIKNSQLDVNRLTFDVINFNIDYYTNDNYSTRGELVNDSYIMITVSSLADEFIAAEYYNQFEYSKIIGDTGESEVYTFTITEENLKVLNRDKDPDRYKLFFEENYLNQNN